MHNLCLRNRDLCFTPLRIKYTYNNLELCCTGDLSILYPLFSHFFLSVWIPMCIFCTLVITWYYIINFLLQLFQFWPLEPLLVGSKYFWFAPFFRFLSTPLLSGTIRCSRLIQYFLCFRPRISHFSKEPWFPLWRNGLRNQDLDLGAFRATGT